MRAALGRAQGSGADQERSETFEKRRGLTYLRRAEPGIRAQLWGTLSQRGKDRFRFRRVGNQSSREQTDGEEATDGMEPAWSTSSPADTNSGARRRVGEYLPALVSGFPPSRAGQESGVTPRNLPLSYVNLGWTIVLSVVIGIILSSAFPAILVYAQELVPGKVGLISGLFFGFAFGIAGIGSAVFGQLADRTSIEYVYWVCSFLPLIGLLTGFLPNLERPATTVTVGNERCECG